MDWFDEGYLSDPGLDAAVKDSLTRQVRPRQIAEVRKMLNVQKEANLKGELAARGKFDTARSGHLLKALRLKQRLARRQMALLDQKRLWDLELASLQSHIDVTPTQHFSLTHSSRCQATISLLTAMQKLLTTRPLIIRNLDYNSPLHPRYPPFLAEESTDPFPRLSDSEKTVEQLQTVPEILPVRVLHSGKWPDEKSTERVGQHLLEIEAKVERIHKAITQRLSLLQGTDITSEVSFGGDSNSLLSASDPPGKEDGSSDGDQSQSLFAGERRLFTPVCVPESPDLSAVEKVPEGMDDWTGSFLDAPSPPQPIVEVDAVSLEIEAFPSRNRPCGHIRLARHSGDEEDLSLSNISVNPLTISIREEKEVKQSIPPIVRATEVSPSSRRVWKCLFCSCFRRKSAK